MDKAVNADSENAPKQLRAILLAENPMWKLPERRVNRYLKRHLKARSDPLADIIDVDMDDETVYTSTGINNAIIMGEGDAAAGAVQVPMKTNEAIVADKDVEAYVDDNQVDGTKSDKKSLFCECGGTQCVIS